MPTKPFTPRVNAVLHRRFKEACARESLTISKGLEIAVDCWVAGEITLPLSGTPSEEIVVGFNISSENARLIKTAGKRYKLTNGAIVNRLMAAALNNCFGEPVVLKRAA